MTADANTEVRVYDRPPSADPRPGWTWVTVAAVVVVLGVIVSAAYLVLM